MGTLRDVSDFLNRSTGGASGNPETIFFYKNGTKGGAAPTSYNTNSVVSLWGIDGFPASGVFPPASGEVTTSATSGALRVSGATGSLERKLTGFAAQNAAASQIILYDRLYHKSGFNANTTNLQLVQGSPPTSSLITRNTSGVGNFMFYGITTQFGATLTLMDVEYINDLGLTSSSTVPMGGGSTYPYFNINNCGMIPLNPSDSGVSAITKVGLRAATGAGVFSIVIGKYLGAVSNGQIASKGTMDFNYVISGHPKIENGACLSFLAKIISASQVDIIGSISVISV